MAVYDAQLQNTARNTRQYTDLDLFFGKKSSNSDIQTITDEEYDGNLTDYQNKVKLHKRLDKELEGTDRVFLKILKNDIII